MAPRRWVVNASPLILLGKTDNLELLSALADVVVVPRAFVNEIGEKPDATPILQMLAQGPRYCVVDDEAVSSEILSWGLGAGETQVIAHAQQTPS